jgi:hypothetical protein
MDNLLYTPLEFIPKNILDIFGLLFFIILVIIVPGLIKIILRLIVSIDTKLNWIIKHLKHKEEEFYIDEVKKENDDDQ